MNKLSIACFTGIAGLFSAVALGAPGEYWEHTTKMEMQGMPFPMPAMTHKICVGKGEEKSPVKSKDDRDCEMTDVKISGNKSSWKMRCKRDGKVMTGSGEQTTTGNSYQGKMHFSGDDMEMTQTYSGKRVGGSCDTGEMAREAKRMGDEAKKQSAQMQAEVCDISGLSPVEQVRVAPGRLHEEMNCTEKQRKAVCTTVQGAAKNDVDAYVELVNPDNKSSISAMRLEPVTKTCRIDMAATTRSICKQVDEDNYEKLSPYCPAEVKAKKEQWRQERIAKRKKHCEAKYSGKELEDCLAGRSYTSMSYTSSEPEEAVTKAISGKSGDKPAAAVLEGAKKLKGLFGF